MFLPEQRIDRILHELEKYIYCNKIELSGCRFKETRSNDREAVIRDESGWRDFGRYDRWGGVDKLAWFSFYITIPDSYAGQTVEVHFTTGREGEWYPGGPQYLVFVDGEPRHHMDLWHEKFILTENAEPGRSYRIDIQAFSGVKEKLTGFEINLYTVDKRVEAAYFDIKAAYDSALVLKDDDKNRLDAINEIINAVNLLDMRKPLSDEFYASLDLAREHLARTLYSENNAVRNITAYCVGHSHFDVAWLWTVEDSKKKAVRTFVHNLELMELYPEYVFMCSQPQIYKYVKESYPEVYEKVRQRIKEGRWQPEGAMWVEPDCNIPSGESFVRQLLLGKRFFKEEFGVDSRILWLPDVFGFSGALPQILKKSGVDFFMTTKLSWNEYNVFPYSLFSWQGIDGTEILSYFTCHHAAYLGSKSINEVWDDFKQKDINDKILVPFGWGDAGGGPTTDMLEVGKRLVKGVPGCPSVKLTGIREFAEDLEKSAQKAGSRLPKWVGELYFELHRGTYTSVAKSKLYNRKSELLYQDCELLSSSAMLLTGRKYPQADINNSWEIIALNQFHDILPGSSIWDVYKNTFAEYEQVISSGKDMLEAAALDIVKNINTPAMSVIVFNQLGFTRSDIVEFTVPEGFDSITVYDADGSRLPVQLVGGGKAVFVARDVPSKGYKAYRITNEVYDIQSYMTVSKEIIANDFFDIRLDETGAFVSVFDKVNNREILKEGSRGNVLQVFEDMPQWVNDAWDINIYHNDKMWEVNDVRSIQVLETGPVRSTLRIERRFLDSVITQDISVYSDIDRIDFKTHIDWKEKFMLLKAAFPVDIHANYATYDIQFGSIQRPNHWNTSWDYARFEVSGHKWADLSEGGYGVSILNDCKYGYDIKGDQMRITLLKSAEYPSSADIGTHEFVYSLYPHAGGYHEGGTVYMGYRLNCPMYAFVSEAHTGTLPDVFSLCSVDQDNVIIETVKKAEDSNDIILRVYEAHNKKTNAEFTFFAKNIKVRECDLMENEIGEIESKDGRFACVIKPFEIKTFKIAAVL
ncbi:MAG TPA: alpha-mannosidase [Candidatus Atribacteria bacterium]|nr:alpha-mannosidase [Candidatus Atribacteria bacterium]